jgi:hypothetical protein
MTTTLITPARPISAQINPSAVISVRMEAVRPIMVVISPVVVTIGGGGDGIPATALTLAGEPLTLAGEYLTLGA